jgi:hypothetical protein
MKEIVIHSNLRTLALSFVILTSALFLAECCSDKGSNPPDPIITYTRVPADYPTIQEAIDSASDFDTIVVSDGRYYERISFLGKSITLASRFLLNGDASHITNTIIDGDTAILGVSDTGSVVDLSGVDTASVLCGITITGGIGNGDDENREGGGIFCFGGSPTVLNCNIANNSATFGGGISLVGNVISISNCTFRNNTAVWGGAIGSYNSIVEYQGCLFDENTVTESGGAVWAAFSPCSFAECYFTSNTSHFTAAGLYLLGSECSVTDCLFRHNTASNEAPAIYAYDVDPLRVHGSTITHNRISSGTGQAVWSDIKAEVERTIISKNENCSAIGVGDVIVSCCNIFGNSEGDWTDNIVDQLGVDGNISLDPMFCDTSASDFRISEDSPCAPSNNDCGVRIGALDVGCDD